MKRIGKHKVVCNSIEKLEMEEFLDNQKAYALYVDPPWGDRHMKYFSTMKAKHTGEPSVQITFNSMLSSIGNIIKNHIDGWVFIEMGLAWENEVLAMMKQNIKGPIYRKEIAYKGGGKIYKNVLFYASTKGEYIEDFDLTGLHGVKVPLKCLAQIKKENALVIDPCCGLGLTAEGAIKNGMRFYGNEYDPTRATRTIERIEKLSKRFK